MCDTSQHPFALRYRRARSSGHHTSPNKGFDTSARTGAGGVMNSEKLNRTVDAEGPGPAVSLRPRSPGHLFMSTTPPSSHPPQSPAPPVAPSVAEHDALPLGTRFGE